MVCSKCWSKLSEFHEFYNSVEKARNNFLQNLEAANFIEIKCEPYGNEADIPFSVKSEPIEEDDLRCASMIQDDEIKNRYSVESSDAFDYDANTEDDECTKLYRYGMRTI